MADHPGRTKAQRRVLDAIGCGNYSPMAGRRTIDTLLEQGFIVELPRKEIGRFAGCPIMARQFEMPIPVHYAWCKAMSAECDDGT